MIGKPVPAPCVLPKRVGAGDCRSEVNNSYQEEHGEVLHAIRDIAKGEELCITYIEPAQHPANFTSFAFT